MPLFLVHRETSTVPMVLTAGKDKSNINNNNNIMSPNIIDNNSNHSTLTLNKNELYKNFNSTYNITTCNSSSNNNSNNRIDTNSNFKITVEVFNSADPRCQPPWGLSAPASDARESYPTQTQGTPPCTTTRRCLRHPRCRLNARPRWHLRGRTWGRQRRTSWRPWLTRTSTGCRRPSTRSLSKTLIFKWRLSQATRRTSNEITKRLFWNLNSKLNATSKMLLIHSSLLCQLSSVAQILFSFCLKLCKSLKTKKRRFICSLRL